MNEDKRPTFPIHRAVALELGKLEAPIVLRYDIARIVWRLYRSQNYEGQRLQIQRDTADSRTVNSAERSLLENGVLMPLPGAPSRSAYVLIGAGSPDRNATVCSVDPFCYLSHLSAMEFHGLTDRMPEQVYVSSPPSKEWVRYAAERMQRDLGDDWPEYCSSGLPTLRRVNLKKVGQRVIHKYSSIHLGAYRVIKGSPIKVATLGRTFLDMLREPDLCGGLSHVIQTFKDYAQQHKRLIFDELDQHGLPIDKVRTGYILEEVCGIHDPRIDSWVQFAARGGSRKLDPTAEYEPVFSERWMLSINSSAVNKDD